MKSTNPFARRFLALAIIGGLLTPMSVPAAQNTDTTERVKVFAFISRRPDLTQDQFNAHWRDPHARLAIKTPLILRYVQNHTVGTGAAIPGLKLMHRDGIASIWVANTGMLTAITADPLYAEVHEDELSLLDRNTLGWLMAEEHEVTLGLSANDLTSVQTKAILFVQRNAGVTQAQFAKGLRKIAHAGTSMAGQGRVTYSLPAAGVYTTEAPAPYDGVVELWFSNTDSFERQWRRHGPKFLRKLSVIADVDASQGFLATEERKLWPALSY